MHQLKGPSWPPPKFLGDEPGFHSLQVLLERCLPAWGSGDGASTVSSLAALYVRASPPSPLFSYYQHRKAPVTKILILAGFILNVSL